MRKRSSAVEDNKINPNLLDDTQLEHSPNATNAKPVDFSPVVKNIQQVITQKVILKLEVMAITKGSDELNL